MNYLFLLLLFSLSALASDFDTIKSRLYKDFLIKGDAHTISSWKLDELKTWMSSQKSNGSWSDIKYSSYNDVSFPAIQHLSRMEALAQAYSTAGHKLYQNKTVLEVIWKSYDYWTARDIESYNWWFNEIGVPQKFEKTMILLEKHLTPERKSAGIRFLNKATLTKTGQNLLWYAEIVLVKGLLQKDINVARAAVNAIQKEVSISSGEGIRADNSFHQHGQLIFSGGYGAKFSFNIARLASFTQGTEAQFSSEKFDIIANYILDGQRWVSRGEKWDYGVLGREITRKNIGNTLLRDACAILANVPSKRKGEFQDCADRKNLSGNRYFWRSDMMAHHRNDFYSSVRMYSKRTLNNDAPSNGEGLLSHHLADGANFIMRDGSEYADIFPVWDWRKIPGTTVEQKELIPARFIPGNWNAFAHMRYQGRSSFVGGVSDGELGVAAMNFISNKIYENVDAKKAWFFFDEGFIALGTDIKSSGGAPVVTTLDQSLLKSEVTIVDTANNVRELSLDEEDNSNVKAILHNKFAFIFPYEQPVTISKKSQQGNWFRINEQYDRTLVARDVFSAWINHGANSPDAAYQYLVLANASEAKVRNYKFNDNFKVQNTATLQAVQHLKSGVHQLVFYEKGSYTSPGMEVAVDYPCIVMIRTDLRRPVAIVSDPTQSLSSLQLSVNGKSYQIDFPRGQHAGKSVSLKL